LEKRKSSEFEKRGEELRREKIRTHGLGKA